MSCYSPPQGVKKLYSDEVLMSLSTSSHGVFNQTIPLTWEFASQGGCECDCGDDTEISEFQAIATDLENYRVDLKRHGEGVCGKYVAAADKALQGAVNAVRQLIDAQIAA